jgi:hypothetical protein
MKNFFLSFAFYILCSLSFTSCKEYVSLMNATKVTQLSGNPFIFNLSKSILKNTAKYMAANSLKSAVSKINLLTPLSAIISSPQHLDGYRDMLASAYKIPEAKLAKSYSSLSSVKDLVSFVANNGQKFSFY